MSEAVWINPERGAVWTYWHPKLGVLGMVWKDLDLYAATGPKGRGEDYHHAELGEYKTLKEAQEVIEGMEAGKVTRLPTSRPRDFGTLKGGPIF